MSAARGSARLDLRSRDELEGDQQDADRACRDGNGSGFVEAESLEMTSVQSGGVTDDELGHDGRCGEGRRGRFERRVSVETGSRSQATAARSADPTRTTATLLAVNGARDARVGISLSLLADILIHFPPRSPHVP